MLKWAVVCILLSMNLRKIRWPIRDMRLLLHFKHFLGISREIRCHYCDFTLRTCLIFTSFIVNQPNNMKSRWTADVNQLENSEINITLQSIKWKIMNLAVEIFPPRWKYSHPGGNVLKLIHNFLLDSLQRNLDFIVFQFIHVGSSSWFHIIRLIHFKWCENQTCAHGEIAIKCVKCKSKRMSLMGHRIKWHVSNLSISYFRHTSIYI